MRNHREEIETALAGGAPRLVPFTFYSGLFPPGFDPAPLQARGLALCVRRGTMKAVRPNVQVRTENLPDGTIRYHHVTPIGTLTSAQKRSALAYAPVEHAIKSRDDYRIARFIVEDTRYEPNYEPFRAAVEATGMAGKVIGDTCYEPLMEIQVVWIGQEQFCYEVADNLDAVLELHEAIARRHRDMYEVVARGPAGHVLYGGNVVPEMLGPERVRDLIAPCWNAFADVLHAHGKKIGCHLDANNRTILDTVGRSRLDFVEAFTPPPDCNVRVDEARRAWPAKRLWLNFPSSVHLASERAIREATLEILRQAGDRKGFLLGVTEDVPAQCLERSCRTILEALESSPLV